MSNNRFKVTINCIDCGIERLITKACLSLVKRCKDCQKEFNRDKARNRYRKVKGIDLDKPVNSPKPKKKKEKETIQEELNAWEAASDQDFVEVEPAPIKTTVNELTEEEKQHRKEILESLLSMIDDDTTVEDWSDTIQNW